MGQSLSSSTNGTTPNLSDIHQWYKSRNFISLLTPSNQFNIISKSNLNSNHHNNNKNSNSQSKSIFHSFYTIHHNNYHKNNCNTKTISQTSESIKNIKNITNTSNISKLSHNNINNINITINNTSLNLPSNIPNISNITNVTATVHTLDLPIDPTSSTHNISSNNSNQSSSENSNLHSNSNSNVSHPSIHLTMDVEAIEKSLEDSRWWRACLAGSIAGLTEHSLLYPIDTIKTRLQSIVHHKDHLTYNGFTDAFKQIVRNEGTKRLFRGLPAVLTAAIPSHAAYFGTYEYAKYKLGANKPGYHVLMTATAGAFATMSHDFIVTPFDVIKQRMQLKNCPYSNICQCAMRTFKREGFVSFIRSYPSTVILNIPVFSTNFVCYESCKVFLSNYQKLHPNLQKIANDDGWLHHLIAGGFAGACAGFVSNPLDVIKTTIQTEKSKGYRTIKNTIRHMLSEHPERGYNIFFIGASARIIYFIPSAAITWTTYEAVKQYLGFPTHDLEIV